MNTHTLTLGILGLLGITALITVIGGVETKSTDDIGEPTNETHTQESVPAVLTINEYGISLTYPGGTEGYIRTKNSTSDTGHKDFVVSYTLMRSDDARILAESTGPREGPPTISLHIYSNTEKLWPSVWAERNREESGASRIIGTESETSVGGAKAVTYLSDGLHVSRVYVVTHGRYVYVLSGARAEDPSPLNADFSSLINGISFTEGK